MSYISLCKWHETREAAGAVSQVKAGRLNSYYARLDQLTAVDRHKPAPRLEYNRDSGDEIYLSLHGGFELFDLNETRYPERQISLVSSPSRAYNL
jgi:hypothetical protein